MKCSPVQFAYGAYGVTLVCLNPMCFVKFAKSWLLNDGLWILSIAGMMADADIDVTIAIAGNQEYKHSTTSTYSLLGSSL